MHWISVLALSTFSSPLVGVRSLAVVGQVEFVTGKNLWCHPCYLHSLIILSQSYDQSRATKSIKSWIESWINESLFSEVGFRQVDVRSHAVDILRWTMTWFAPNHAFYLVEKISPFLEYCITSQQESVLCWWLWWYMSI